MMAGGKRQACVQQFEEGLPEIAGEARVAVRDDDARKSVMAEDGVEEDARKTGASMSSLTGAT